MRDDRARLIGALARWCGDLQFAEDGFADAVERAVRTWGADPPVDPGAWVTTVARNRIRDALGAAERTRTRAIAAGDDPSATAPASADDTLALMLACAHPSLDRAVHAPLILQVVMGVATVDIATAYALPVATLAKRLVRAKQRLRADPGSFEIPDRVDPTRVGALLDAIYAGYASDWMRPAPTETADRVADEAVHASQLLLAARPDDLEVRGLAALLLFLRSRQSARIVDGRMVPLDEQDPHVWDAALIDRAEALLRTRGFEPGAPLPGPYELQAAIQSAHAARRATGITDWTAVARLHDALVAVSPSRGAAVARAVAIARATEPEVGLRQLDALIADDEGFEAFQPWHAARAGLLDEVGHPEAAASLRRAIALSTHAPSRRYLEGRLAGLG